MPNAFWVDPEDVQSNIVLVNVGPDLTESDAGMTAASVCERLREKGVLALSTLPGVIRFVTHSQVRGVHELSSPASVRCQRALGQSPRSALPAWA